MAFTKISIKLAKEAAKRIKKQKPSISHKELKKEVNEIMGDAGRAAKAAQLKRKAKTKATGTGLSKPTVVKNKNKRKYEANVAEMGGGRRVGSDAARRKAMTGKELQDAWQGLTKGDQRYERAKGKDSKYYSVIKKLDAKPKRTPTSKTKIDTSGFGDVNQAGHLPLKAGGKVMKYKKGGMVYKKHGGVVKAAGGDNFIASCYD
jgi:hypothetical protein